MVHRMRPEQNQNLFDIGVYLIATHGHRMTKHDTDLHKRVLLDGDHSDLLPRDLNLVLQGVHHVKTLIRAGQSIKGPFLKPDF